MAKKFALSVPNSHPHFLGKFFHLLLPTSTLCSSTEVLHQSHQVSHSLAKLYLSLPSNLLFLMAMKMIMGIIIHHITTVTHLIII
jgi:hypothetical protein